MLRSVFPWFVHIELYKQTCDSTNKARWPSDISEHSPKVSTVNFTGAHTQHTSITWFSATHFLCISFQVSRRLTEDSNRQLRTSVLTRLWLVEIPRNASQRRFRERVNYIHCKFKWHILLTHKKPRYLAWSRVPFSIMFIISKKWQLWSLLLKLTLIPAWIDNYMPRKVWDEITYPFLNTAVTLSCLVQHF